MFRSILLTTLVLYSTYAHSIEIQKVQTVGEGEVIYSLYGEGDHFFVNAVLDQPGYLPQKLWQRTFSNLQGAQIVFNPLAGKPLDIFSKQTASRQAVEVQDVELWHVTNQWSFDWELRYQAWVEQEVDADFMVKNNIATDCADVAYSLRWIFSRINGLPAVNRIGGGRFFTHRSMKREWLNLPTHEDWRQDRRFLAALDYLLDQVYTHTLENDSYPLAIRPNVLIPGAHFLYIHSNSGHTLFVYRTSQGLQGETPLRVMASTTPRNVRHLYAEGFSEGDQPEIAGFLKMRWPRQNEAGDWVLTNASQMPGFSREQYSPSVVDGKSFDEFVFDRIAPNRVVSPAAKFDSQSRELYNMFMARIDAVNDGYRACFPNRCPEGSDLYEVHSTPSRDSRLLSRIKGFEELVAQNPELLPSAEYFLDYEIEVGDEFSRELKLSALFKIWKYHEYSVDPNLTIDLRWGLRGPIFPIGKK